MVPGHCAAPLFSQATRSPRIVARTESPAGGTANVAYASSLEYLNENVVKPAFTMENAMIAGV